MDTIAKILAYDQLEVIEQLIMNTKLSIASLDLHAEFAWLNYYLPKCKAMDHFHPGVHKHSFHELHLCLSGNSSYTVEGKQYMIKAGDIILVRAQTLHCCLGRSADFGKISLGLGIDPDRGKYSAEIESVLSRSPVVVSSETQRLQQAFLRILEEFEKQALGYLPIVSSLLLQVVLECARMGRKEQHSCADFKQRVDGRISQINAYIDAHMDQRITCEEIAENIHISARQINRIVQKEFACSLSEYVMRIKCNSAKNMLLYSDQSIGQIATFLGYSDVFSFSKFFKRIEGMSPSILRSSRYHAFEEKNQQLGNL